MGRKADFAADSTAIGKKSNAVDRPSPSYHGPRGVLQRGPWVEYCFFKLNNVQIEKNLTNNHL